MPDSTSSKNNTGRVVKNGECCGCGACIDRCPTSALFYSEDSRGFFVPIVDNSKCIECMQCLNICPVLVQNKKSNKSVYAAIAKNKEIRKNSSSGGIFYFIASYFLKKGDIVYGCTIDADFQVKHIRIADINNLSLIMRSKYVQSNMCDIYKLIKKDLNDGKKVLFSGTPCQVSAVNNFCNNNDNLFTVDVVCHGIPSQTFFNSYINSLVEQNGEIKNYTFRTKRTVNNGMNWYHSYYSEAKKKNVILNWPEDTYNYLYMMGYINRDSCYQCKYTTAERVGDITLCDYWGYDKYHKQFRIGSTVSGVLINSEKAEDLVANLRDELIIFETDFNNLKDNNGALSHSVKLPDNRDKLFEVWQNEGFAKLNEEYKRTHKKTIKKYALIRKFPQFLINKVFYLKRYNKK